MQKAVRYAYVNHRTVGQPSTEALLDEESGYYGELLGLPHRLMHFS